MHQLLKTTGGEARRPMKWEDFLRVRLCNFLSVDGCSVKFQLMREMGFEYDPSTAGSSVRFDPPNKNDRVSIFFKWVFMRLTVSNYVSQSITFHKRE